MEKRVLKKLQSTELDILNEIDRICKKNNIKYFLIYGTLLGAVRHNGFIPWDDDIDIGMLQEDYIKFIEIASSELNDKYLLDCEKTNKNYYLPFTKVRNKLTSFEEKSNINYNGNKGIWVDIFPFGYTKYKKINTVMKLKFKVLGVLYGCLIEKNLNLNNCGFKAKLVSKILTKHFTLKLINTLTLKSKKTNNLVLYNTPMIFDKNDFFPTNYLKFESYNFSVPNNYNKILRELYGDYKKLPPVNQRQTHNPLKIVFEDGETQTFKK